MKRSGLPRPDPEKVRAWQQRSRKRIPRRSAKRIAADAQTADLRRSVAALPCLLAPPLLLPLPDDDRFVDTGRCGGPGTPHHLEKASAGGPTTAANLVPLCARHNLFVEDHPPLAQLLGLVIRPGISPDEALHRRMAAGLVPLYTP